MDQEDIDFLEEVRQELLRIDADTYEAEAKELGNVIYRAIMEKNSDLEGE